MASVQRIEGRLNTALADRYRIESEIGSGGMATVYLAEDLKHKRKVALKVLRPELSAVVGSERFLAEIETTANLQHPNILPLFDSGEADGLLFYVMPFVEGESLQDRLDREKQLPIEDALAITDAVGRALDYAHRHGVIHRDIKPANILIHDGQPVVADFGIALAVTSAGSARLTETGLSLGTPHYMSPEQATGDRELDPRTDVYSLACVLHEMLLGDPPYTGSTARAVVSQILTSEPEPLTLRRATVPQHVDATVRKALAKVPADRFSTAGQFAEALANPALAPVFPTPKGTVSASTRPWKAVSLALAGVAVGAIAIATGMGLRERPPGPAVYDVGLPDSAPMAFKAYWLPAFSVAPDGSFVVYVAERSGTTQLWFRSLLDDEVRPIPGTEEATAPVLSPDGERVAFKVRGQLRAVPIEGGPAAVLADITDPAGIVWVSDDQMLLADHDGNLLRWLDPDAGDLDSQPASHCVLARPMPLGAPNRVICGGGASQFAQILDLDDDSTTVIQQRTSDSDTPSPLLNGSDFRLLDDQHLTYISQGGDLRVLSLDQTSLSAGRPVTMVSGVRREGLYGAGQYGVASSGALVYAPGANAEFGRLVKVVGDGQPVPLPMEPAAFLRFDLSPDGRTLAAVVRGVGEEELRIYEMETGQYAVWQRGLYIGEPLWEPFGDRLLVFVVPFGGPPATILGSPTAASPPDTIEGMFRVPVGYMADGRLLVWGFEPLQALAIDLTTSPPVTDTLANDVYFPSLSPDDRWLAYQNRATGQLLLEPHPAPNRRYQVADEAWEPRWLSPNELVYWIKTTWYRVTVGETPDRPMGEAQAWFTDPRFADTQGESYMVTPDGGVIYVQGPERTTASFLRVVPNWMSQMKQAVADAG